MGHCYDCSKATWLRKRYVHLLLFRSKKTVGVAVFSLLTPPCRRTTRLVVYIPIFRSNRLVFQCLRKYIFVNAVLTEVFPSLKLEFVRTK